MKKGMASVLALICVLGLVGCNQPVKQQDSSNTPYFFTAKVMEVDESCLLLSVFDTGNTNLAVGATAMVSAENVPAGDYPGFVVGEYVRVLLDENTGDHPADRLEALTICKAEDPETAEASAAIPDFSYADERALFAEGEPGVKTSGFVNTSDIKLTFEHVTERAKKECTMEYDHAAIYFDTNERVWKIHFSHSGTLGGDQTVYLDHGGKTILVVYGE